MIINHNLPAMNTNRQLSINNNNVSKSLEKLSSGLRINKAGDDAAGLAISEKMRAQIRGLDMSTKNAQDGVSLLQTAEGNLQSIENILQRMRELAVESSNDTNVNQNDREAVQLEVDALVEEIDRIASQSEFNTQKLLDGSFKGKFFHIGANINQNVRVSIDEMSANALKLNAKFSTITSAYDRVVIVSSYKVYNSVGVAIGSHANYSAAVNSAAQYYHVTGMTSVDDVNAALVDGRVQAYMNSVAGSAGNGAQKTTAEIMVSNVGGSLSLATQKNANTAIKTINDAINTVSMQRAKLGAVQNRLEYSIENLEVSSENTSAAESRIRDVNMSKEMMNFTKNNILSQAATAMLAQANQTPQNVLQLLR